MVGLLKKDQDKGQGGGEVNCYRTGYKVSSSQDSSPT